jgi:hypothetical protein
MKKFLFSGILFFLASAIWFSCKKETTLVPSTTTKTDFATMKANPEVLKGITVKDGILYFSEGEQSFNEYEALLALTNAEYTAWANANNFVSLFSKVEEANEALEFATTMEEYNGLLTKYDKIIQVVGDQILPRTDAGLYQRISNFDGYYAVGKAVCRVVDDRVIEARDGNISKLLNVEQIFKSDEPNNIFVVQIFDDMKRTVTERDGNCGFFHGAQCRDDDRQVFLNMEIVNGSCGCGGIRKLMQIKVWGEKKNIWGKFKSYSNPLDFNHGGYEVRDQFGTVQSFDGWSASETSSQLIRTRWIDPQPCYSGCQVGNQFIKVKGTGDSQGVGAGHWAWICCGYTSGCPEAPSSCD